MAAIAVLVTVGSTFALGSAGATVSAKTKKVSTSQYAKTMCTTYNATLAKVNGFADDLGALQHDDAAAYQGEVSAIADTLLAELAAGERTLKSIYPDTDGGKKISKQFAKNAVELQKIIGGAVQELVAADPTSPAFSANVTVFGVTLSTLGTRLTDVTIGIDNQDFIGAIGDEKRCHKIFPVTGG